MREVTRAQKARLGLFLVVSVSLLLILLLIKTGTKFLEKWDPYFVRYQDVSVSGLEVGAQVKYHGVRVGRVDKIAIDKENVSVIRVTIQLRGGTPVKDDVEAEITATSLTGLKIIELTGGSHEAPLVFPGSEIPAGESAIQAITGRAEIVSEKLEMVLNNLITMTSGENQERVMEMVENIAIVLEDFHTMLQENRDPLANTFQNLELASQDIRDITSSPELKRTVANLDCLSTTLSESNISDAVSRFAEAVDQAHTVLSHMDVTLLEGRRDLLMSLEVLREGLESFNEFSRLISEDPSLIWRGSSEGEIDPRGER